MNIIRASLGVWHAGLNCSEIFLQHMPQCLHFTELAEQGCRMPPCLLQQSSPPFKLLSAQAILTRPNQVKQQCSEQQSPRPSLSHQDSKHIHVIHQLVLQNLMKMYGINTACNAAVQRSALVSYSVKYKIWCSSMSHNVAIHHHFKHLSKYTEPTQPPRMDLATFCSKSLLFCRNTSAASVGMCEENNYVCKFGTKIST